MERKTKIIATIGPASRDEKTIRRLFETGVDVARLNFSHGTHTDHAETIASLRRIAAEMQRPICILQDLQGPKIRVGQLDKQPVLLQADQTVLLSPHLNKIETLKARYPETVILPVDFLEICESVHKDDRILLDDGNLQMVVSEVTPEAVQARVIIGGPLTSHKGINLPGAQIKTPGFTEKDRIDLAFGLEQGVDVVAISFVRTAEDISTVRQAIRDLSPAKIRTPIIAKLERPEALENLESILKYADGVMVARGDLGVELSPEYVPIAQKKIIAAANRHRKIVITATQMLDSMIHNPRPTRAEASDVANAIFDGTDAVMLSGETASGKYPVESVMMMQSIICQAESNMKDWGHCESDTKAASDDDAVSTTRAAHELSLDRNVSAIAVFTQTGHTALLMSKTRPDVPILAFTPEKDTYHFLQLYWGVTPLLIPFANTFECMINYVEEAAINTEKLKSGQQVILISGFPIGEMRPPNFVLLHTLGEGINHTCKSAK